MFTMPLQTMQIFSSRKVKLIGSHLNTLKAGPDQKEGLCMMCRSQAVVGYFGLH